MFQEISNFKVQISNFRKNHRFSRSSQRPQRKPNPWIAESAADFKDQGRINLKSQNLKFKKRTFSTQRSPRTQRKTVRSKTGIDLKLKICNLKSEISNLKIKKKAKERRENPFQGCGRYKKKRTADGCPFLFYIYK